MKSEFQRHGVALILLHGLVMYFTFGFKKIVPLSDVIASDTRD
jgi:hypothetical protein